MDATVTLYVLGLISLTVLLYRYMRYSNWRSTPIGRAFVLMKSALVAIFVYALAVTIWPDADWQNEARLLLIGYANIAIVTQTSIVVKFQGGWYRNRPVKDSTADDSLCQ